MIRFERQPKGQEALEATRLLFERASKKFEYASPDVKGVFMRLRERQLGLAEARVHIAGLPYQQLRGQEIDLANYAFDRLNVLRKGFGASPVRPDLKSDVRILRAGEYDLARRRFGSKKSIGLCVPELGIAFIRRKTGKIQSEGERFEPIVLVHEATHLSQYLGENYGWMEIINEGLTEVVARDIMTSKGGPFNRGSYDPEVNLIHFIRDRNPETYLELQRHAFTGVWSQATWQFYKRMIESSFRFKNDGRLTAEALLEELKKDHVDWISTHGTGGPLGQEVVAVTLTR